MIIESSVAVAVMRSRQDLIVSYRMIVGTRKISYYFRNSNYSRFFFMSAVARVHQEYLNSGFTLE